MSFKRICITLILLISLSFSSDNAAYSNNLPLSKNTGKLGTIVYHRIQDFNIGDIPAIGRMKMSLDGSKIVFSCPNPKAIYTINADGTNLVKVFDYADYSSRPPWISPFIDIDSLGTTIIWTDGVGEIFVASSDGSNRFRVAYEIPYGEIKIGPNIPLRPRITAKGDKIFFCNTSGDPQTGGVWSVGSNGGALTQLFKHSELMDMLNFEYNIYWANYAYSDEFDISNDGSHIVFGTSSTPDPRGKLMGFDGALKILFDYAPRNEGSVAISADGSKLVTTARNFEGRNPIWLLSFGSGESVEIINDAGGSPINFGAMPSEGNVVIAQGSFPISLIYTRYKETRFELVNAPYMRGDNGQNPFFSAGIGPVVSMTSDARRFCFPTLEEFGFSRQHQIWVADINPAEIPAACPFISETQMDPPYVAEQWKSSSTFSAKATGNTGNVTFLPFKAGVGTGLLNTSYLFDDGPDAIPYHGDVVANDNIYTVSPVGTNTEVEDYPYSIRFFTCNSQYVISVEAAPFFVLKEIPSVSAPQILSIEPAAANCGEQITITGTGFNSNAYLNVVIIGNIQAYIISATTTQLVVDVPFGLSSGVQPVTVSVYGQTSNIGIITIGGEPHPYLNPPRNLVAQKSGIAVLLSWDPPLTAGLTKAAGEINEIEPNNTPQNAQIIAGISPVSLKGKAEVSDQGTMFLIDDIEDLFKVTISAAGLKILLENFSADCYLSLFNETGTEMLHSAFIMGALDSLKIDNPSLAIGSYLIGVSIVDQNSQSLSETNYTLTVTGQLEGEINEPSLMSYNIYRSQSRDARFSGSMLGNIDASNTTYQDNDGQNQQYYYQVTAVYNVGESGPSNEGYLVSTDISNHDKTTVPNYFELFQNCPNPFNSSTMIEYYLPQKSNVELKIFNLIGQEVITLVNEEQAAGNHSILWHGYDNLYSKVSTGVYIYQFKVGKTVFNKKMIVLE